MKSLTAVCQTAGASSLPAINASGRITRHPHHRGDGENAEMKMYLSKLKDLVPFMPKNRKLSKLEIIQHVIDYICDLQSELETHPEIGNFDATSALNFVANAQQQQNDDDDDDDDNNDNDNGNDDEERLSERLSAGGAAEQQFQQQHQQQQLQHSSPASRQPLVDRQTPNTILPESASFATAATAIPMQPYHHHLHHHQQQQLQQQQQLSLATAHSAQTQSAEKDSSRQPC